MISVYKRELRAYFTGAMGYIFIAFTLVVVGIYSAILNFGSGYPNFEYVLSSSTFVFLLLIPILTMRSLAEERRQKTDQLLFSLPLRSSSVVLGKYFAMVTVMAIPSVVFCVYPQVLALYGEVHFASAYATILAFFLMGCALIAIGLFVSSVTENQLVAAILSFSVMLLAFLMTALSSFLSTSAYTSMLAFLVVAAAVGVVVYVMTRSTLLPILLFLVLSAIPVVIFLTSPTTLEGAFQRLMSSLSVFDRMANFTGGILDVEAIVYYISVSFLFVFLTVQSLEKRRWS